ncbi:MAG: hypothetical protein WEB59_05590 [Thermoanaerobaculia bacterium]
MSFWGEIKVNWAGYLVVGLFGGLLAQAFNMHGKLTEVSTTLNGLAGRVDRIASALPDLSIRVAQEELSRPVQGAIVVASAAPTASGEWVAPVHVLSADARTRDTYLVSVSGPEDKRLGLIASGLATSLDKTAVSFEKAAEWSARSKDPSQVPGWVDSSKSFLLRAPESDYAKAFEATLASTFPRMSKSTQPIVGSLNSWKGVSTELTTNSAAYTASAPK